MSVAQIKMNSTLISSLVVFAAILSQTTAVPKFNELWATDLFSTNMSFQKYENKLVLMHLLSPVFSHPGTQVGCLNALYDRYHDRGLEIVAVSSWRTNFFNRRLLKYYPRFDLYSYKHAKKNIDAFLASEPLTRLDHRNVFFILQDMQTFLHIRLHSYLCDPKNEYFMNGLRYDIDYYLAHPAGRSPTNGSTPGTDGRQAAAK